MSPRKNSTECRVCNGMLGPLRLPDDILIGAHPTCAKMDEDDWRALKPWFRGDLRGVQASGA